LEKRSQRLAASQTPFIGNDCTFTGKKLFKIVQSA
jgi:hypothetical protein